MKHVHILMAVLTIGLFLYQFMRVMAGNTATIPSRNLKITSHILYTLLLLSGALTLMPLLKLVGVPHWVIGKIILFIVAISATVKATRPTTAANQAKVGMFIALIAYIGIVTLAIVKPMNLF